MASSDAASALSYAFQVNTTGSVTIEVAFDLGYDLDVSAHNAGSATADVGLTLFRSLTSGGPFWMSLRYDADSIWLSEEGPWAGSDHTHGVLRVTADYQGNQIGGILLVASAHASYDPPCGGGSPCILPLWPWSWG